MRGTMKSVFEAALAASGVARLRLRRFPGHTLILAYHDVIPGDARACGDVNLHIPQERFGAHLDVLATTHDIVPLSALFETRRTARPRAVITFDDAYRGALTAGLDELERRGLPSTVFAAPGLFGTTTWWDRLADPATGRVPDPLRAAALDEHAGRTDRILEAFGAGSTRLAPWASIATEDEILAAAQRPGVTIGAHSWSHPNLARLPPGELMNELHRPLEWLDSLGPRAVRYLAFPYGQTSRAVAQAAAAAGYERSFHILGGWVPPSGWDAHHLARWNISAGLSPAGLSLRACGVLSD